MSLQHAAVKGEEDLTDRASPGTLDTPHCRKKIIIMVVRFTAIYKSTVGNTKNVINYIEISNIVFLLVWKTVDLRLAQLSI